MRQQHYDTCMHSEQSVCKHYNAYVSTTGLSGQYFALNLSTGRHSDALRNLTVVDAAVALDDCVGTYDTVLYSTSIYTQIQT